MKPKKVVVRANKIRYQGAKATFYPFMDELSNKPFGRRFEKKKEINGRFP